MLAAASATPRWRRAKSCADQVIADWYDDGRVGKIYPLECYREAIANLPPDVLDYSNAKEEIGRALAFAKQGKPDPGGQDPTPGTRPKRATTKTGTTKTGTTKTATTQNGHDEHTTGHGHDRHVGTVVGPVPLLVLGGLAVLLLAAGSAGYLRRRMNGDEEGDDTPPASARRRTRGTLPTVGPVLFLQIAGK